MLGAMKKTSSAIALLTLSLAAIGLSACGSSDVTTMTLQQGQPVIHNPTAKAVADQPFPGYHASLSENGKLVGVLIGARQVVRDAADLKLLSRNVKLNGYDSAAGDQFMLMNTLVFEFGDNNSIMAQGPSLIAAAGNARTAVGKPIVRAIIGGTGKYKFANGQLTSTRNADGGFTQVLEFKN
jgi:hypothetical protein